ncbi:hypothetical protein ACIQUS_09180 [Pseudomonas sp. NPDC090755]|uniref:hypothetical protein n=1 Tax=Pseudomonas sp. NPDC090755 TaxID=3364481 RepID=UPI00383A3E00
MSNQNPTILIFMTRVDEIRFSQALSSHFPQIAFIDIGDWDTKTPLVKETLADCHNDTPQHSIWNKAILSTVEYSKNFIFRNESKNCYFGATVGPGLIQYIRSSKADYDDVCLRNGRLSSSYDPKSDPRTDSFVKETFKILKKGARRVYLVNRKTGKTEEKPEIHFFAWPDAADEYNGHNGKFLTNNSLAYFIAAPQ